MQRRWLAVGTLAVFLGGAAASCGESASDGEASDHETSEPGGCARACEVGQSCVEGECVCNDGLTECGADCVSLESSGDHCGRCDNECPESLFCSRGECEESCADGLTPCGSSCTDLATDVANCGECGRSCSGGRCVAGDCISDSADGSGANGSGANGEPLATTCREPELWPLTAATQVVGDGTAASCTGEALREAVAGGGYIRFDCGATPVTLSVSPAIEVTEATIVDGEGQEITLDGGGTNRIFDTTSSLSVRNLRFINGKSPSSTEADGIGGAVAGNWRSRVEVYKCVFEDNEAARGGGAVAVWTDSELTIIASRFQRNRSWYGGAVYSLLSPLTVVNSEFVDNEAVKESDLTEGEGGAIGTDGASASPDDNEGGTITICGSTIRNNRGRGSGGGVYIWAYPPDIVHIERTVVEGNTVAAVDGGGSLGGGMRVSNGEITITASSILSNHAESHGGGLYLDCALACTITNSTFFDNEAAPSVGDGAGYGGAIFGGGYRLNNVTFARNFASGHGGALFGGPDWVIENSLFVDNGSGNPWDQARSCSDTGSGANVLQWLAADGDGGDDRCIPDIIEEDPVLDDAPADNGGPTPSVLLGEGSAALQAGSGCEPVDQRGEPRDPNECDLGAVEMP